MPVEIDWTTVRREHDSEYCDGDMRVVPSGCLCGAKRHNDALDAIAAAVAEAMREERAVADGLADSLEFARKLFQSNDRPTMTTLDNWDRLLASHAARRAKGTP